MNEQPKRFLKAIMFTDIIGFTSIMGKDENLALSMVALNREIHQALLAKYNGKFLKEMGDGILASFNSALDAVLCAKDLQEALSDRPNHNLKIGIHLGDVIEENNDVFGDGVNVASRIEALGKSACILISETVYQNIKNKEGVQAKQVGEQKLKNVVSPVKIYQVLSPANALISLPSQKKSDLFSKLGKWQMGLVSLIIISGLYYLNTFSNNSDNKIPFQFENSIAILPFWDLLPTDSLQYLNGVAEGVRNSLTKIPELRVVAKTSAFQIQETNDDFKSIGTKLNAKYVVSPQVEKINKDLLISINLVNTENGYIELFKEYPCSLENIETIKEQITADIQHTLNIKKPEDLLNEYVPDNEAYKLYLKGDLAFEQLNFQKAVTNYTAAIKIDSLYADPYAGLCAAYQWFAYTGVAPPGEAFLQAKNWGRNALSIEKNHPFANGLMGIISNSYDLDYAAANDYFDRALKIAPTQSSHALLGKLNLFAIKGDIDRADSYMEIIIENDPLNYWTYWWNFLHLRNTNRIRKALPLANEFLDLYPGNIMGPMMKSMILMEMDTLAQESVDYMKSIFIIQRFSNVAHFYFRMLMNAGHLSEANQLFEQLKEIEKVQYVSPYTLGYIHLLKGEEDKGFEYLNKALQVRDVLFLSKIENDAFFDPYRKDPRYQSLIDNMGLGKWLTKSLEDIK